MSDKKDTFAGEWTPEQWRTAWNIKVGRAYACEICGTVIMVTKGGVGNLEPICCRQPMEPLDRPTTDESGGQ